MAWKKRTKHDMYGGDYRRKRERVLKRDRYICQCSECKRLSRVLVANEVDHVVNVAKAIALGWTRQQINAETNLQAINYGCHMRKTIEEQGKRMRPQIGVNGYPMFDEDTRSDKR